MLLICYLMCHMATITWSDFQELLASYYLQ